MKRTASNRSGVVLRQPSGYHAYIPNKLQTSGPKFERDREYERLLADAHLRLGELNGIGQVLPDPDLFVAFYVKKEALLSSQIEGTQSSMDEVLQVNEKTRIMKPVDEVVNYVNAMNNGLPNPSSLPFSTRLLHNMHALLMDGVRGQDKTPGIYKTRQNWIGPSGCTLNEALFVPPPPQLCDELMNDLEKFYHLDDPGVPELVRAAIIHYQFETIHPYADGNGRLGRLIITLSLVEKKIVDLPLLYLSLFFKENKQEYYDLLMKVRFEGAWEQWFKFFLRGVRHTSTQAVETAKDILALFKEDREKLRVVKTKSKNLLTSLDHISRQPIFSITSLAKELKVSYPTAQNLIASLVKLDILREEGARGRDRVYMYHRYLDILRRGT